LPFAQFYNGLVRFVLSGVMKPTLMVINRVRT
jgi:hypothetical protein